MANITYPNYRKIRVASGWAVHRVSFYDISPDAKEKFRTHTEDNGWNIFEQDLLLLHYPLKDYFLDVGWIPKIFSEGEYSVPEGQYVALLVQAKGWEELKTISETRSLKEITDAVNEIMLQISLENGDYENYPEGLQLQEFMPTNYFLCRKNEFFDIEPNKDLTSEQWQLFKEEMLALEPYNSDEWSVKVGWFPAFDPNGQYLVKARYGNLSDELKTRDKAQLTNYLDNVFTVHLKRLGELYAKQQKSEKERQRQARLQIQRNQKV